MSKTNYTISFDEVHLYNRWRRSRWNRNCDWVLFGVSKWWFSPEKFAYKIHLFGLDIQFWFSRKFIRPQHINPKQP